MLRPSPSQQRPARLAARAPTGRPEPAEPVPSADLWPDLPARQHAVPEPVPVAAQFARWQRLTAEQAAT